MLGRLATLDHSFKDLHKHLTHAVQAYKAQAGMHNDGVPPWPDCMQNHMPGQQYLFSRLWRSCSEPHPTSWAIAHVKAIDADITDNRHLTASDELDQTMKQLP